MRQKGIKHQITLSSDFSEKVERELKETLLSKSVWFTKLIKTYFDEKEKGLKKVIDLKIDK